MLTNSITSDQQITSKNQPINPEDSQSDFGTELFEILVDLEKLKEDCEEDYWLLLSLFGVSSVAELFGSLVR